MEKNMNAKVALITGSGKRRVGNAVAEALAAADTPLPCTTTDRPKTPGKAFR